MIRRPSLPVVLGALWAAGMLALALVLPHAGGWTIDDGIKRIAAATAEGPWAELLPDGPVRGNLLDPADYPPFEPPFAARVPDGFAPGFSPWARGLFHAMLVCGAAFWQLAPALVAVLFWVLLARGGFAWSFLLLPLTFYGLVPWEHATSWLLAWPALWLVVARDPAREISPGLGTICGVLLAAAVLLRPETALMAVLLVLHLLTQRQTRPALSLATGGLLAGVLLVTIHGLTAQQPVLLQLRLNFAGPVDVTGSGNWLADRLYAFYRLFVSSDLYTAPSLLLFILFVAGVLVTQQGERAQKKALLGLGIALLALWWGVLTYRLWSHPLPVLTLVAVNSLFVCLPWTAVLFLPPYRNRPLFAMAVVAMGLVLLTTPTWQGVHWGPRLLLFAVPLLMLELYRGGRTRTVLFSVLLVLTALQTVNAGLLVTARRVESGQRIARLERRLGALVICRNQHQCADLAPLWPGREFFAVDSPVDLRALLAELHLAGIDSVSLHVDAFDSLYVQAFPEGKPVRPVRMTVAQAGNLYRTWWRVYELALHRTDTLWAPLLEAEAGRRMLAAEPDAALRLQRQAVALAPAAAQSHHNLALILAQLGRADEARAEATMALDLDPELTASRRLLELLAVPKSGAP